MKFWAKPNRGAVLSIAVLLVVVIYLIALQFSHTAARPDIKSVCGNYIRTAVNYRMLPVQYRTDQPDMPQTAIDSYIEKMTDEIKAYYPANTQGYKYAVDKYAANLIAQAKGNGVVYSYMKEILSFSNFDFNGSSVTVTILTNSSFDSTDTPGAARASVSAQTTDTITLQKIGGVWKVVYADLPDPSNGGGPSVKPGMTVTVTGG
jgi:hypothetical protein